MIRFTLEEIARLIGAEVHGDGARVVTGVNGIDEAENCDITFVANDKYRKKLLSTRAAGAIVSPENRETSGNATLLVTPDPYRAFSTVLRVFHPAVRPVPGVSAHAHVAPSARMGPDVTVFPFVYVGRDVSIGARSVLYPFVHVGDDCVVGEDCTLYPHVSMREGCVVGNRVMLHNGVTVGSDGFGFVPSQHGLEKIPQVGIVRIEDDVEVGAGTCIDRATMGETRIGRGTKIDNLVQVAHNVRLGEHVVLVAQVGISGSTTVGDRTILAGQTGVAGHLDIGKDVKAAAKTGIVSSVEDGSTISGSPSLDHKQNVRVVTVLKHLPELRAKVRQMEKELEAIKAQLARPSTAQ